MKDKKTALNTLCVHAGELEDKQFKGAISPLYMSTSYAFEDVDVKRYPVILIRPTRKRFPGRLQLWNTGKKLWSSVVGMAAISTALMAFLHHGDHVVFQKALYGGTFNLVMEEFDKFGITYSFTQGPAPEDFEACIRENTKVLFLETPSNPLLTITDVEAVAGIARKHGLISMLDNTFASPVNQNPIVLGIDIVIHSATKYLGGHSDILAGAVVGSDAHIDKIFQLGKNLGGNLSDFTVWLLERSIKTLGLRVKAQNRNAKKLARFLEKHPDVSAVYYPGLKSHPDYALARKQMKGFGGMLSFELREGLDARLFMKELRLIKPSMSLAGVESTISSPMLTSHALLSEEDRKVQGISDETASFSVGIEDKKRPGKRYYQGLGQSGRPMR